MQAGLNLVAVRRSQNRFLNHERYKYISQDACYDHVVCVAFYDSKANFKGAEIFFIPGLQSREVNRKNLLFDAFENFGIGILEDVDNAKGINILRKEMLEDNLLFVALSIEKMSCLRTSNGRYMSSTRGYLIFQSTDKIAVLSNQIVTPPGKMHDPKVHVEKLKREILEFKNTFDFGAIPDNVAECSN